MPLYNRQHQQGIRDILLAIVADVNAPASVRRAANQRLAAFRTDDVELTRQGLLAMDNGASNEDRLTAIDLLGRILLRTTP